MYNRVDGHVMAVKKEIEEGRIIPTKNVEMDIIDLDNFMLTFKHDNKSNEFSKINIGELVNLKEHIDNVLGGISDSIEMFIHYDKKSPRYWGKLEKCPEYNTYDVSIDLESFMQDESEGKELIPGEYFLPDNYALAKKVEKAFKKAGGDMKGECGDHFRECTNWQFKSKAKAQKLVNFIDKTYVKPALKEKQNVFNIKKIIFGETQIEFEYN